jgi:hypothetical protein
MAWLVLIKHQTQAGGEVLADTGSAVAATRSPVS